MVSNDTIRALAIQYLHTRLAYLPMSAEPVTDVAAFAGEAQDLAHAENLIRRMADETVSPIAYQDGTGETLVGLRVDTVEEVLYWIRRYDPSELPPGLR